MRYLGSVSGSGTLKCDGCENARVNYTFEGYSLKRGMAIGSGEVELAPAALRSMFRRRNVELHADDGHIFELKFSGTDLLEPTVATVEITGGLPEAWGKR